MTTLKIYRIILTLSWIFFLLGIVLDILFEDTLPKVLFDYIQMQDSIKIPISGYILAGIYFVLILSSYIGVYLYQYWGRNLFLFVLILGFIPIPIEIDLGPSILTEYAESSYNISYILIGLSLGMMFFSDEVIKRFNKKIS